MGESAGDLKTGLKDSNPFAKRKTAKPDSVAIVRPTKLMRYRSLHHHTTFSYMDGYGLPESHVRRATELGMQGFAVTEHGNVSSHVKLEMAASKEGVQPIYGCELYTGDVTEDKRTQRKNHLTVLASDQSGYRNLLLVVSQGWSDFYYEPTVSGSVLAGHKSGLFVLSGCTGSLLATSLVGGKNVPAEEASYARGKQVAARFKRAFGDRYFLEVQAFPELENVCRINVMMEQLGKELKIPLVATGDVHYTKPSESEMQQILHSVGRAQSLEDLARNWGYHVPLCPLSDREMYRRLRATGLSSLCAESAILATEDIAQSCMVELPKLDELKFPVPYPYQTLEECWRAWLKEGWRFRKCHHLPSADRKRYQDQLLMEMGTFESKKFVDYLMIVSDIVKFAKNAEIAVGPARGSAAASIVCWLLRITEVNPMIFPGMVFERFIDPTRTDPPDIDLDFDSERRGEIDDYAISKYGAGCVSHIGTFTFYRSKNSLDDVARVHHVPKFEVETIKELLLERSSGDLRASATIEDTLDQFEQAAAVVERYPQLRKAMELEGNVKGMGVHAAGLVISNGPITDVCAVYERVVAGELLQVISLDKIDAERQGLIKIDILGLSTMSMIKEALRMSGMKLEDLYEIPLDDEEVIDGFRRNDVVGIFQFDGRAMRSVNAELQPDSFKEICDVNALARPGPLHNNASAEYIDIKKGRKQPAKVHPLLDNIIEDTHYQIVYQEQILRIVREIGGFDWTAAAYIRKIISKKLGEQEFNRQWEKFRDGALSKGMEEETARTIWGNCITAGAYAFNFAHCVGYGMLAYWTMWLKVHHPVEFYVACLQKYDPKKHQLEFLRDAAKHGIEAHPPSAKYSLTSWTSADGALYAGFEQVKGIAEKLGPKFVEYREEHGAELWEDYLNIRGVGMAKVNALRAMEESEDPFEVHKLGNQLAAVKAELRRFGLPYPTHTSMQVPYSRGNDTEVVWLGIIKHRNLRDLFESNFARTGVALDPETVKNPELDEWVIMIGADEDELLSITVDRWKYPRFKAAIWGIKVDHDLVLVRGVKKGFQARRAIYVKDMWVIDPAEDSSDDEELTLGEVL